MPRFVLFDIDETLINSGGAGRVALNAAFEQMTGIADGFRDVKFAGMTDFLIIGEAIDNSGLTMKDGWLPEFVELYLKYLARSVLNGKGYLKKGVKALVQRLSQEEEIFLGLLTGNIERGARIKLEPHSLNNFFSVGAFGSDDADRNRLLPVAVGKLAQSRGIEVPYSDCLVIGDTPRDVECANLHGAASLAVATGAYSKHELKETAADLVVEDLSDTDEILAWIKDGASRNST
jgi:phosphoglycolate phosphatase-like HAD superfamily hydrolase